jgi:hypothetical protein
MQHASIHDDQEPAALVPATQEETAVSTGKPEEKGALGVALLVWLLGGGLGLALLVFLLAKAF